MQSRKQMRLKREFEMLSKLNEFTIEVVSVKGQEAWLVHFECPPGCIFAGERYTWGNKTALSL